MNAHADKQTLALREAITLFQDLHLPGAALASAIGREQRLNKIALARSALDDIEALVNGSQQGNSSLCAGLHVVEVRRRRSDKTLGPWEFVAAFAQREDAYSFYGKYHQTQTSRVRSPKS